MIDYVILGIILILVILVLADSYRRRRNGIGCCGDCAHCSMNPAGKEKNQKSCPPKQKNKHE